MTSHNQGSNGKRKQPDGGSDFVANTNAQNNDRRRKGKPFHRTGGSKFNLEAMLNQPCPKHRYQDIPSTHPWKDCFIMKEYKNSGSHQDHSNNNGPHGGSGSGSHGPGFGSGGSNSGYQNLGN